MPDKLMSLSEAVQRFIPDGSSVAMGTALESFIPFAAGHEIMRQGKKKLALVGPISDILFDQLIGAGCVGKIQAAWMGNVITGSGYNIRRAVEGGRIVVEDHSNLTVTLALLAGAMGVPFLPARTALGSDLPATNPGLQAFDCPLTGQRLMAVAAINPDVAIAHAQRCDATGAAHIWGNFGNTKQAALAAKHVIVTAEEIVPPEVIRSDPNRVLVPAFKVSAVCHVPWGAHPSGVPGHYNRDHQAYLDYQAASRTEADFAAWLERFVTGVDDRAGYCRQVGQDRLAALRPRKAALSEVADYGY
ncbi:MAG: CoA transferase subunit A [Anaerolineae bacterium]